MKKFIGLFVAIAIVLTSLCVFISVSAEAETPVVKLYSANLSLDNRINYLFTATYENVDIANGDYGMIIWTAEQDAADYTYEKAAVLDKAIVQKGGAAFNAEIGKNAATYLYGVAAKEMADVVYIQAYAVSGGTYYYSDVMPYSVTTYASHMLYGTNATTNEELRELIVDMLEYGASAQKYFKYNLDNLATEILTNPPTPTETFTVTFKDWDGTVLKTETVEQGKAATAPVDPIRSGYKFIGWDKTFDNVTSDIAVTAQYVAEYTGPAFILSSVTAVPGASEVIVTVTVKNNPGILGAEFEISYDSSVLTLISATNNVSATGVSYTSPSQYKNPTVFLWDAQDLTWIEDGVILTLVFSVSSTASDGNYNITLNYDPYNMMDENFGPIDFAVKNATIEIRA